jgi:hypothetical protein
MPTPPIEKIERDGSYEDRLICTYKREVPDGIKVKLINWLKENYGDYVRAVRWINAFTVRISLKIKCLCEAGAHCVEQALRTKCEGYVART